MTDIPPIDFDALQDQIKFDNDPIPRSAPIKVTSQPAKKAAPAKTVGRPTTASVNTAAQREMQEEIEGFLMLIGVPLTMRDHHADDTSCGDNFVQYDAATSTLEIAPQARALAIAFAKVGVDNKYIRKFFESASDTQKWVALAMALTPFITSFTSAHVKPRGIRNVGKSTLV